MYQTRESGSDNSTARTQTFCTKEEGTCSGMVSHTGSLDVHSKGMISDHLQYCPYAITPIPIVDPHNAPAYSASCR